MLDSILLPRTHSLWFNADQHHEDVQVPEYQMYAVEKWLVDKARSVHVLLVYTGDPDHRITLSKYTPHTQEDYDLAVQYLRRDGARPKHTPHGVLFVTSLAHFRSDFTIVKVPDGDFAAVKDQLYANINLLRMGCSGRSALALEEPSDPTKERFLSAYHLCLPPNKGKDRGCFTATVLELVKLIQAGLAVFDCYGSLEPPTPSIVLDGLLCDETVEGIHRWIADIGEPCLGLEPTERVADPSFVSALLSMVLAIRNKLAALVASSASSSTTQLMPVPKDPFIYPYAFSLSLMSYLQHASTAASTPVPSAFLTTQMAPFVVTSFLHSPPSTSTTPKLPVGAVLSREIVDHIDMTYDKAKAADNRRVRRVLKGKLDDLTRSNAPDSDGGDASHDPHHGGSRLGGGGGALSDSEASHLHLHHHHHLGSSPGNSIGSTSGNRVLGGISMLLPGTTSHAGSSHGQGGTGGGAGSITEGVTSLAAFLSMALSKETGGSSFAGSKRANLKRIRGSVGGGITAVSSAGSSGGEHKLGKGLIGKGKRQRESVDMGSFYTTGTLAAAAGMVSGTIHSAGNPVEGSLSPTPPFDTKDWDVKEKEGAVGGSVKALWGGRVMDLVRSREWCEEVAHAHGLGNGALVLPSSTYYPTSLRAVSGSTVTSQQSGGSIAKKAKKKIKGKEKEHLKPSSSHLLAIHSDGDPKSDTGRSTEGEESESVVYPSASNTPLLQHPDATITPNPLASASFGSLLGGRVRGKLGNWAGLARRKGQSVDLSNASPPQLHINTQSVSTSANTSPVVSRKTAVPATLGTDDESGPGRPSVQTRGQSAPLLSSGLSKSQNAAMASVLRAGTEGFSSSVKSQKKRKSTNTTSSGPQSPTLPPMVYPPDLTPGVNVQSEPEDYFLEGEVLSSGQISPLSDHKPANPFLSSSTSRTRPPLPRHFSLSLPPSQQQQQQDRTFLSVASVNEKLARLGGENPSARSSLANLPEGGPSASVSVSPSPAHGGRGGRRRLFLYQTHSASSNVFNVTDDDRVAEESSGGAGRAMQQLGAYPQVLRRPKFNSGTGAGAGGVGMSRSPGSVRSSATGGTPRVSSWSDPLSARHILGGAAAGAVLPLESFSPRGSDGEEEGDTAAAAAAGGRGGINMSRRGTATRNSSLSRPFGRTTGGGGESEGDVLSESSVVSGGRPLATRPSIRARRRTEQAGSSSLVLGAGTRDDGEGAKRDRSRFYSLFGVVDREGNSTNNNYSFAEDQPLPVGSWGNGEESSMQMRGDPSLQMLFEMDDVDGLGAVGEWGLPADDMDDDVLVEGGVDLDDGEWVRRRRRKRGGRAWCDPMRRRSFQDLDDYYDMPVIAPVRMKVDVDMCGQVLVMLRREEHLRNVVACLEILNSSLAQANSLLRHEYETHLPALAQLTSHTKVLADLDLQSTRTDNLSQQTNVLRYEAEQFHVPALYHTASLSRQKVLEMRHKVFGMHKALDADEATGQGQGNAQDGESPSATAKKMKMKKGKGTGSGRVLPEGVRGAHGKFNRLQKRLNGDEVVVDWLGRTESEAEEEERLLQSTRGGHFLGPHGTPARGADVLGLESEDDDDASRDGDLSGWGSDEGERYKEFMSRSKELKRSLSVGAAEGDGDGEGEGEAVEHSSIRPMWLLKFFMGWGARWSARAATAVVPGQVLPSGAEAANAVKGESDPGGQEEESRKDR